jgi:predicted alpha/beta superfamily hydrolase
MRILKLLTIVTICLCGSSIFAQKNKYEDNILKYNLSSKEGKEYILNVTLPPNFNPEKKYQSLYYLDGYWLTQTVNGTFTILNLTKQIEDVVLIGISLEGSVKDWNIQRSLDYTPSVYSSKMMGFTLTSGIGKEGVNLDESSSGQAANFLTFLEDDVFRFVKKKYPNINLDRTLLGHSLGGLFTVYMLQQKPQLFSNYIIISPSLWWNKQELNHIELFKKLNKVTKKKKLYFAYGDSESGLITKSNQALDLLLQDIKTDVLEYKFKNYLDADHHSVLPQAIYDGLVYIYKKP